MGYEYGKDVLNIKNPFKDAARLMLIRGAITTIIGVILLLSIKDLMNSGLQALAYITLLSSLIILADGITNLFSGVIKLFRFLVGREVPKSLNKSYSKEALYEMLEGRKNFTFKSPANFLEHLTVSIYENYMFLPPPLRKILYQVLKMVYFASLIMISYGIILLTNYLGFSKVMDNNLLPWYTFILLSVLFVMWLLNQPTGQRLYKLPSAKTDIIFSLVIIITSIGLPFASTAVSGVNIPYPPIKPVSYVLLILLLAAVAGAFSFALAFFRAKKVDPATLTSEFREHWSQNLHPQDVFRSFTHELDNIRYKELPHRVYLELNPQLNMEGSMDKGTYAGETMVETQPYSKNLNEEDNLVKLRLGAAILGHLMGIIASIILFFSCKNLNTPEAGNIITMFLPVVILFIFSSYLTKLALVYWSEVTFESFLIYLKIEGSYTESTISTGKAIYDSTSSENKLVRSSITSRLLISRLFTSTFAGGLAKNLNQPRFVLTLEKADDMQNLVINGIKKFMSEKEVIASIVSEKDKESTNEIHKLNVEQRKNIIEDPEKEIRKFKPGNPDNKTLPPSDEEHS